MRLFSIIVGYAIVACIVSAVWALGEYLARPGAGYHLSGWAIGAGIVFFLGGLWRDRLRLSAAWHLDSEGRG